MSRVRLGIFVALWVGVSACGSPTAASPSPSPTPSHEPLVIASMPLKPGEVGLAYSGATFDATGGVQPYMFQITEGLLPQATIVAPAKLLDGSGEYVPAGTSNQPAQGSSWVRGWGTITGSRHLPNTLAVCVDDVGKVA